MKPLDQTNRDWTRGNCFYVTLEFLKDSEQLRSAGAISSSAAIYLVHGLLDSDNLNIKHAWIEIDDEVLDHSNKQCINAPKDDYYTENNAMHVKRFTREQADALLSHLKAKNNELPIFYWGEVTDEEIQKAASTYIPENGTFASGVIFSDPNDPANNKNLIIKSA